MSAVSMEEVFAYTMSYKNWRKSLKPEKRVRKYQHLDDPLDLDDHQDFQTAIQAIKDVRCHQFLPFIKKVNKEIRFRKVKGGAAKRSLKLRPIMYASHVDSHIYSYYNFLISAKYEEYLKSADLDSSVIAYRKIEVPESGRGKSNIHFAKEVFDAVRSRENSVVITQDISHFFDEIDHKILKDRLSAVLSVDRLSEDVYKVFGSLTKHRHIDHKIFFASELRKKVKKNPKVPVFQSIKGMFRENLSNKGIPQGSPISGLFANIYLLNFDKNIREKFKDVSYYRYSDDIVAVCSPELKEAVCEFIDENIKLEKLDINPKKTFISYVALENGIHVVKNVTDGFGKQEDRKYIDYLGFEFHGNNVFLRKNTIQKLRRKQLGKVLKQLKNTSKPKRREKKKHKTVSPHSKGNYFNRSSKIMGNASIRNQVLRIARKRNSLKASKTKPTV